MGDSNHEFRILMLGAMNWLMAAAWAQAESNGTDQEFQAYYINAWLPRQRELIDKLQKSE